MQDEPVDESSVLEGVIEAACLTILVAALIFAAKDIAPMLMLLALIWGVAQILYLLPLLLVLSHLGRNKAMKGVAILAAIVFLLNATCYGLAFTGHLKVMG